MTKLRKRFYKWLLILLIIFVAIIATAVYYFFKSYENENFEIGVDFSIKQAQELNLDWQKVYLSAIHDLNFKKIRISANWDLIEPTRDIYDFDKMDWLVKTAQENDVELIFALGRRTPRWPECHDPKWLKGMNESESKGELLEMLRDVIERYKDYDNITTWQVENEPLLDFFGQCPKADPSLLKQEVALVKTLDTRPVLITDSGELGLWIQAASIGDMFGTTLYRVIHNDFLGYSFYSLPPAFYRAKAVLTGKSLDNVIISELQAEPWSENFLEVPVNEQKKSMDANRLKSHIIFAKRTGFQSAYLWGLEWWYLMNQTHNDPSLFDVIKSFNSK